MTFIQLDQYEGTSRLPSVLTLRSTSSTSIDFDHRSTFIDFHRLPRPIGQSEREKGEKNRGSVSQV